MKRFRQSTVAFLLALILVAACVPSPSVYAADSSSGPDSSQESSKPDPDEKYYGTKLPRYETPSLSNKYYFSALNVFYISNYGMPNCTAYAWGRAYEYYGTRPSLSYYNAGEWWYDNINWGTYEFGSEPRVGAIAVWDRWDQDRGHVAFVEAVNGNQVTLSESAWQGDMFRVRTMKADGSNYLSGGTYRFLGYIYADEPYWGGSSLPGEQWKLFDSVTARYGPGTDYSAWVTVPSGAEINVLEMTESEGYLWGKIYYAGVEAWCILDYAVCLSDPSLTPDPPAENLPSPELRRVDTSNGINLRYGPGTKYSVAEWIPDQTKIEVSALAVGSEYTWAKTTYNGTEGWCVYDFTIPYVEAEAPEDPENPDEPTAPEDRPILKSGSRGQDVRDLQEMLNQCGYDCGKIDGIYGQDTAKVVMQFQKDKNLSADGIVGIATWKALYKAIEEPQDPNKPENPNEPSDPAVDYTKFPEVYSGKENEYVKKLQERLNELGYNCGTADGAFGGATYTQVVAFQKANGLTADGIVGQATWAALYKDQVKPNDPEKPNQPEDPDEPSDPAVDYTKFPEVYTNKENEYVKKLQERLNELGYNCGTADGYFGGATYTQVVAFQKANGLTADGIVGQATWAALYKDQSKPNEPEKPNQPEDPDEPSDPAVDYTKFPEVYRNQDNEYVKKLQERLNELKYDCGIADGYFGAATYTQVVAFQKANGLTADGIVGQATWAALYKDQAKPNDPEEPDDPEEPNEPSDPAVDYTKFPEVYRNKKNEYVKKLQERLNGLGYNCGPADGYFGSSTYTQVVAFQKAKGLDADGIVGQATWKALYEGTGGGSEPAPEPTPEDPSEDYTQFPEVYNGKSNEYVKKLQERLNALGYDCGIADGEFGGATYAQVVAFQKDKSLVADGIVGQATWKALYEA